MQVITSKDNDLVKNIKKLKEKKFRDEKNQYVVEGIKLVAEAIEENTNIDSVVVCEDCVNDGTIDNFCMKLPDINVYMSQKRFLIR